MDTPRQQLERFKLEGRVQETVISSEEQSGLRLLARLLVRAYLKDREAAQAQDATAEESPHDVDPV